MALNAAIDVGENNCNRTFRVPLTRQCMVISTSSLVGIIDVGVDACGINFIQIGLGVSVLRMRDFAPLGTK